MYCLRSAGVCGTFGSPASRQRMRKRMTSQRAMGNGTECVTSCGRPWSCAPVRTWSAGGGGDGGGVRVRVPDVSNSAMWRRYGTRATAGA